jgi:hypothetical protein
MDKNIWKGNYKGFEGEMKENCETMRVDELAEFDRGLEKMSDLLQEYRNLQHDAEEHYNYLINTY